MELMGSSNQTVTDAHFNIMATRKRLSSSLEQNVTLFLHISLGAKLLQYILGRSRELMKLKSALHV